MCLRDGDCEDLQSWEIVLANVASRCEYAYSAMGRVGFLYESVKDQLKWAGLRAKQFAWIVMRVGDWMALDEEQYEKEKVKRVKMDTKAMEAKIKAAFGGGL